MKHEVVKKTYRAPTPGDVAGRLADAMNDLVSPALITMGSPLLRKVCQVVATDYGAPDPTGETLYKAAVTQKKFLGKLFVLDETLKDAAKLSDFSTNDCVIVHYDPQ